MKRLNIYFIHSKKFNYQNIIYKKVLQNNICLNNNIIFPYTKKNESTYIKDLLNISDIIIIFINNPSFGLWLELKMLQKINKPKLFLSLEQNPKSKYLKLTNSLKIVNENNYLEFIEQFINENNTDKDNIITLGEINK